MVVTQGIELRKRATGRQLRLCNAGETHLHFAWVRCILRQAGGCGNLGQVACSKPLPSGAFMNANRRWVIATALIVAAPSAALSQVQQAAAPPAGMLNPTGAAAAVAELKAAMEDNFNLFATSGAERAG